MLTYFVHELKLGYRLATAKAPLGEDIARAMVNICNKDSKLPEILVVVDPFCGSGTLAIETALALKGSFNKYQRDLPLEGTKLSARVKKFCKTNPESLVSTKMEESNIYIVAGDRDAGAIQAATSNAQRAGVDKLIEYKCQSVSDSLQSVLERVQNLSEKSKQVEVWIITNPPFGRRLSTKSSSKPGAMEVKTPLLPLYQKLGNYVNKLGSLANVKVTLAMVAHDSRIIHHMGLDEWVTVFRTNHGGIPIVGILSTVDRKSAETNLTVG